MQCRRWWEEKALKTHRTGAVTPVQNALRFLSSFLFSSPSPAFLCCFSCPFSAVRPRRKYISSTSSCRAGRTHIIHSPISLTRTLVSQPRFTVHSSESHYQNSGSSKTALWDLFNPKARRCLPLSLQQNNLINGSGGDTFMFPMQILLRKAINGTYGRREPTKYTGPEQARWLSRSSGAFSSAGNFIRTITSEEILSFSNWTVNCFCFPWYPKGISGGIFLWSVGWFSVDWGKSFGNFWVTLGDFFSWSGFFFRNILLINLKNMYTGKHCIKLVARPEVSLYGTHKKY